VEYTKLIGKEPSVREVDNGGDDNDDDDGGDDDDDDDDDDIRNE